MANLLGYRTRRTFALYRMIWGGLQAGAGVLLLTIRATHIQLPPESSLRTWLRAMIWDNTFIDQVHFGVIHIMGTPFRIQHGIWALLGLAVLNVCCGIMVLKAPYWARWIGTIVFGVGFIVGIISLFMHPTWFRAGLTVVDLVFFGYFAWLFPRHLVLEEFVSTEAPIIDKIIENA